MLSQGTAQSKGKRDATANDAQPLLSGAAALPYTGRVKEVIE